jgi:hypothetical protein
MTWSSHLIVTLGAACQLTIDTRISRQWDVYRSAVCGEEAVFRECRLPRRREDVGDELVRYIQMRRGLDGRDGIGSDHIEIVGDGDLVDRASGRGGISGVDDACVRLPQLHLTDDGCDEKTLSLGFKPSISATRVIYETRLAVQSPELISPFSPKPPNIVFVAGL